jgi:hypothetical protein
MKLFGLAAVLAATTATVVKASETFETVIESLNTISDVPFQYEAPTSRFESLEVGVS